MYNTRKVISAEMIKIQNDNFGLELEKIVSLIHDEIRGAVTATTTQGDGHSTVNVTIANIGKHIKAIETSVAKRFGITCNIIHNSDLAAVLPFFPNKNHIFINEFFRGNFTIPDQEKIIKKSAEKKGFVDTVNAKVSGLFSEYNSPVWINFQELFVTFNLSPSEVTAVILHELGHIFHACEYSDRFESANQVLLSIAKDLKDDKKEKNSAYIFKELKNINSDIKEEDVDKMINGGKIIAGYYWFKAVIGIVDTQMRNNKYDESSFEQLADNFAARFNYGRQLVSGLDKLHSAFDSYEKSRLTIITAEFFSLMTFTFSIIGTLALIPTILPLGILAGLFSFAFFRLHGEDKISYTYDDLQTRYKRIRQQLIERLKDENLNKKYIQTILDELESVDEVIAETFKYKLILRRIANAVFGRARDAKSSIEEQQLLEELANNDLFVLSAQAKSLEQGSKS